MNRFFCDLRRNVDPKQLIKPRGRDVLYMYGTATYRTVNRFFFATKSIRTVRYRTLPYGVVQKKIYVPSRTGTLHVPCNNYANRTRTVKYGTMSYMYRTDPYRGS